MLGKRDAQRSLFGAAARLAPDLEKLGFYGKLATDGHRIFRDSDFRSCYSKIGRPSAPPSVVAIACLLQHYEGISDDQVIERLKYDLRWKAALDLDPLCMAPPFAKSTFQAFRLRLTLHAKEGVAFEKSIVAAREARLLPKRLCVALDSSPVRGRGAVKDTFNLLSDAIRAVVRAIAKKRGSAPEVEAARLGIERHFNEASIKGSEVVDWQDSGAVTAFLASLLEDCDAAVVAAKKQGCATKEVELLERVIEQDIDRTGGDDGPAIRRGVAKGRVVSVSDPEMRHGRKSSGKTYNGHKAHVAVDTKSGVITAVDVTSPHTHDGERVRSLLDQTESLTGSEVNRALGDSAYSSTEAQKQAAEARVDLVTKMPTSRRAGRFGPGDFRVSKDGRAAVCPAGHKSVKVYKEGSRGRTHRWPETLCSACPLREQCLDLSKNATRRFLNVTDGFHDRRRREAFAASAKGRATLRARVKAEHAIGRVKNRGAGVARCFGRPKTRMQWLWTSACANLSLVWTMSREAAERGENRRAPALSRAPAT